MYKTLSAPLVVQIEIESACPNTCIHCYNFWRKDNRNKSYNNNRLSIEDIEVIMHKLAGVKVFEVVFTGGEPLLNKPALFYGIKLAQKFGIGVSLNSNLTPLTEKDAAFLKTSGVHSILTSIMGSNADIHDAITLRDGSFEDTIRGIKYLQKVNLSPTVNIVLSKKNKGYLRETIKFLASTGIKHISSTRAGCPGNCSDFSALSLTLEDFRVYLEELYSTGQEIDINFTKTQLDKAMEKKAEYDVYIEGLDNSYLDIKDVWNKLSPEIDSLYQQVKSDVPSLNTDLFVQYRDAFSDLVYDLN